MTKRLIPALAAGLFLAGSVLAQGIVIDHRPEPVPRPTPTEFRNVFIKNHSVSVTMKQNVAETTIDQVFHNPNDRILEGTYVFPLPETAAIGKFTMFMDGKEIEGEVLEADQARGIYESIVRSQRDPGLLEYVGRKMIRASVFPIPAQGDVRIRITYAQELETEGGVTSYEYPLNSAKFSKEPLESVSLALTLTSEIPLKSIYSPTHPVEVVRKGDHEATIHYEGEKVVPDADFRLYYQLSTKDLGLALLTHRQPGEDGYFLVMISPKEQYAAEEIAPKDLTLVVDTSGSMLGPKMDQARKALLYCLDHLNAQDRFQIVHFSTEVHSFGEGLADASSGNLEKAKAWVRTIEARGGTNISGALAKALEAKSEPGRLPMFVFVTDGKPTIGERDTSKILEGVRAKNPDGARIFVFGVGNELNTHLLDLIAEQNHGTRSYVGEKDDLDARVASFYEKVSSPVLADLELAFDGMKVKDLYPKTLPDLFKGQQLVLFGRYAGEGDHAVKLSGRIADQSREYVYEGAFPTAQEGNDFLPRLWARRKVGYLLDQIRLHGESQELKDEIVLLGKKYGIVTPYTSFLVLEEGMTPGQPLAGDEPGRLRRVIEDRFQREAEKDRGAANGDPSAPRPSTAGPPAADAEAKGEAFNEYYESMGGGGAREAQSGERAVEHSKALDDLKKSDNLGQQAAQERRAGLDAVIQRVEDKTFYWRKDAWVDGEFDAEAKLEVKTIVFLSDEYFELARKFPKLAKYLSIGESVVVLLDGTVYKIVPEAKTEDEKKE